MNTLEINTYNSLMAESEKTNLKRYMAEGSLSDDDQNRASGCILMYQNKMLLQKRSPDSDEGGTYACFGGSAKLGENLLDTMYREVEEECGLSKEDVYDVLPFAEFTEGDFLFKTFIGRIRDKSYHKIMTDKESEDWIFLEFGEALKKKLHPNFRMTLEQSHQEYMDYMHEFDYVKTVDEMLGEDVKTKKKTFFESVKIPKGGKFFK